MHGGYRSYSMPLPSQAVAAGVENKSEGEVVLNNNAAITKVQRADRKSRNGKGRGLPKKGKEAFLRLWLNHEGRTDEPTSVSDDLYVLQRTLDPLIGLQKYFLK